MLKRSIIAASAVAGFVALVMHNAPDPRIMCDTDAVDRDRAQFPDSVHFWTVSADRQYCISLNGEKVPSINRDGLVGSFGRALAESEIGRFVTSYTRGSGRDLAENIDKSQELAIN